MHANYHTDKAYKMKLVYQYYTEGKDISVLNCDVGCGPNLKTTHELESKVQHSINDGIVGSKKWTDAVDGMWAASGSNAGPKGSKPALDPSHCAPLKPWDGKIDGVDRASTLHIVKKGTGGECGAGVSQLSGDGSGDDTIGSIAHAVCAALASIDVSASELVLITVGDDSAELEAFESLLKNGVVRLSLRTKVLVITYSAKAREGCESRGRRIRRVRGRCHGDADHAQVARRACHSPSGVADAVDGPGDGANARPVELFRPGFRRGSR